MPRRDSKKKVSIEPTRAGQAGGERDKGHRQPTPLQQTILEDDAV